MKAKKLVICFASIWAVLILFLLLATYFDSSSDGVNDYNIGVIQKSTMELSALDNEFAPNKSMLSISTSSIKNDMISVDSFCCLINARIVENTIKRDGFSFDLTVDDYIVQSRSGVLYANFNAIANGLGFEVITNEDGYYLSRLYATKRLIVDTSDLVGINVDCERAVECDDITFLQYQTEYKTYLAMQKLLENDIDVEVDHLIRDMDVQISSSATKMYSGVSEWDGSMMGFDNYKNLLESYSKDLNDVVVAVLDTGINVNHELFQGRILTDLAKCFVAGCEESEIQDGFGHGSHVAGTIAYWTLNNVKLLPLRIMDNKGIGYYSVELLAFKYLNQLVEDGINLKVVNCSYGTANNQSVQWVTSKENAIYQEVKKLVAKDVAICTSAGNSTTDIGTKIPACYEEVFTISSITRDYGIAKYSNYGNVDFCAPGSAIISAGNSATRDYVMMSGTSMASPHIATALALLFSNPEYDYSLDEVYDICATMCSYDLGDTGWDKVYGYGCVDLTNLTLNQSQNEYEQYNICLSVVNKNGSKKIAPGVFSVKYQNEENRISVYSTSHFGENDIIAKTNDDIYLDGRPDGSYTFLGWYYGFGEDIANAKLLATSKSIKLPLSLLHERIYLFALIDVNMVEVNLSFTFKDVEEYTGFASYNPTISYTRTKDDGIPTFGDGHLGIFVENQVCSFKTMAAKDYKFSIYCKNDSKICRVIYVAETLHCESERVSNYSSGYKSAVSYNEENQINIIIIILV